MVGGGYEAHANADIRELSYTDLTARRMYFLSPEQWVRLSTFQGQADASTFRVAVTEPTKVLDDLIMSTAPPPDCGCCTLV